MNKLGLEGELLGTPIVTSPAELSFDIGQLKMNQQRSDNGQTKLPTLREYIEPRQCKLDFFLMTIQNGAVPTTRLIELARELELSEIIIGIKNDDKKMCYNALFYGVLPNPEQTQTMFHLAEKHNLKVLTPYIYDDKQVGTHYTKEPIE